MAEYDNPNDEAYLARTTYDEIYRYYAYEAFINLYYKNLGYDTPA